MHKVTENWHQCHLGKVDLGPVVPYPPFLPCELPDATPSLVLSSSCFPLYNFASLHEKIYFYLHYIKTFFTQLS